MTSRRPDTTTKPVRPAKQERSRRTLERLLDATTKLLEKKGFDDISVAEIAHQAESSVGAFYARFNDKEGLLEHLGWLARDEMDAEEARRLGEREWGSARFETVVGELMRLLVWGHRRHRGTLRALVGRSLGPERFGGEGEVWQGFRPCRFLVEEIGRRRGEITHPDPDMAVHLGLMMAVSTVRDRFVFSGSLVGSKSGATITDAVFVEELTRVFVSFLGVNTKG